MMDDEEVSKTVEGYGYNVEDWIPIFEVVEERPELEDKDILEKLENGWYKEGENNVPINTGGEEIYNMKDGDGFLILRFGPYQLEKGEMVDGSVNISKLSQGGLIDEKYEEVLEKFSAPYLEDLHTQDDIGYLAGIKVPEDYSLEDWEETVDVSIEIMEEIQELQDRISSA